MSRGKNDNPDYTKEQIYDTLKNEDKHQAAPVGKILKHCIAQIRQLEQLDTVNQVKTRAGNPGFDDNSDDSLDNTGKTSGQERVI